MFRSLRARLVQLLSLLVAAAIASGLIMFALFEQSTTAQIGQAGALAGRACDAIGRAYRFYSAGRQTGSLNLSEKDVQGQLSLLTFIALRNKPGIEGGLWQQDAGALAYAFPSYEGSGPKTDVPQAELSRIVETSQRAQKEDRPELARFDSPSQTLLITACPLPGPVPHLSAWTMTRVHSLSGKTYWQLMSGLGVLVLSVVMAAIMAVSLILTWSKHVTNIVEVLAGPTGPELSPLERTGERELDYIVDALNGAAQRLRAAHQQTAQLASQVATTERLAAVGRVTAGVAHEFRNPLAAMRLKAEVALVGSIERKDQALTLIIGQIDRLDGIIGRLLTASERDPLHRETVALSPFLAACVEPYRGLAASRGVTLAVKSETQTGWFDPAQMRRAIGNLVQNALQEDGAGRVLVCASTQGAELVLAVRDRGGGPPESIRRHLFDPFVSGAPERAGLGLAIVREIAGSHGGRAEFEREDNETVFRIIVPCPAS